MTKQEIIKNTYEWFEEIFIDNSKLNMEEIKLRFSENFIMNMNQEIKTNSYDSLYSHFKKFVDSGATMKIEIHKILESFDELTHKDYSTVYYTITKEHDDNVSYYEVIAIWEFTEDLLLNRMDEVVYLHD